MFLHTSGGLDNNNAFTPLYVGVQEDDQSIILNEKNEQIF